MAPLRISRKSGRTDHTTNFTAIPRTPRRTSLKSFVSHRPSVPEFLSIVAFSKKLCSQQHPRTPSPRPGWILRNDTGPERTTLAPDQLLIVGLAMFWLRLPTKPATPAEYKVIFVTLAALLILMGLAGVVAGLLAPPDKQEAAKLAIRLGFGAIGIGALLLLALWLIRRWTDS